MSATELLLSLLSMLLIVVYRHKNSCFPWLQKEKKAKIFSDLVHSTWCFYFLIPETRARGRYFLLTISCFSFSNHPFLWEVLVHIFSLCGLWYSSSSFTLNIQRQSLGEGRMKRRREGKRETEAKGFKGIQILKVKIMFILKM